MSRVGEKVVKFSFGRLNLKFLYTPTSDVYYLWDTKEGQTIVLKQGKLELRLIKYPNILLAVTRWFIAELVQTEAK